MTDVKKKKKISNRTLWTIIVLLLFVVLGIASGLLYQKLGGDYSFESINHTAEEIIK